MMMEKAIKKAESTPADDSRLASAVVDLMSRDEDELERVRAELISERDARLRLAAEFDNYRRRTRKEMAESANEGKRQLLEELLSVADDLNLALANLHESSDAVVEVLRMSHKRLVGLLEANGVVSFISEGERFDPERHDAFDVIRDTENLPGTVHNELRRGYFWNGKLLRPALVTVAQ
jgi:molecular chaperone GrpE